MNLHRIDPLPSPGDPLVGAVMMGGGSRRFGSNKALAMAGESAMGTIVVSALRGAGIDPVVAVGGDGALDVVTIPDRWPGEGPLAALATVLRWARRGRVLVVPCDLPRLSAPAVTTLVDAGNSLEPTIRSETAVVATVDGEPRHSVAIWPAAWAIPVRRIVERGERKFVSALDIGPWIAVELPAHQLVDADTPEELERILNEDHLGD